MSTAYARTDNANSARQNPNKPTQASPQFTPTDIQNWVCCNFAMGLLRAPNIEMYWNGPLAQPSITSFVETVTKYRNLSRNLHWLNTAEVPMTEQALKTKDDAFWKIAGFLSAMSSSFESGRIPWPDLTLDEGTIGWRGRHKARCFNPSKPEKYHLKFFSLNEARSGYCYSFFMYQGRDEKRPEGISATAYPVHRLVVQYESLHHKGYFLWADNWFTSLYAARACLSVGVEYTGTVRVDRCGKAFGTATDTKKETKGWDKGTYRGKECVLDGKSFYAFQWQDNKVVTFLSTMKGVEGTITRNPRKKKEKGTPYSKVPVPCPSIVLAYNAGNYKVGTNRMDQQVALYYCGRRWRWHVKVIMHIFHIALFNSYITYLDLEGKNRTDITYLKYTQMFLDEMRPPLAPSSKYRPYTPHDTRTQTTNQEKEEEGRGRP